MRLFPAGDFISVTAYKTQSGATYRRSEDVSGLQLKRIGSDRCRVTTLFSALKTLIFLPLGLPNSRNTPSPIDPDSIEVPVGYEPDPADLALSSVPGQEMFDPRKRKFSAEELKPQPMIKKARKIFIPEDLKDDKYWVRRRKNNMAAKRSRDARRLKENQIAIRASFLEKENSALRHEVAELRKELGRTKNVLAKYEASTGRCEDTHI
ncbi:hepatic leukemia factor-like isoform X2 [Anarrhichthys ocellatus]|uniref:hepatic leukemia factor-like isoform X2 n=1 Tax=Anarrhichthys ocellatus TaxID=433405 RepID=UPI0012EE6586|nr:hepatic leukemia factor-like isoform X2 [Anarrhichthys ocellatus]